MNEKTCFFIGNRDAPSSIEEQLIKAIELHITEYGVRTFVVGHYGAFDRMVAIVLTDLKKKYKYIKLYLLAPYALTKKIEIPKDFESRLGRTGNRTNVLRYCTGK